MKVFKAKFDCLTNINVTIEGHWLPLPNRKWEGIVSSPDTLVAVSFLCIGNHLYWWCKSERIGSEPLTISLALFPYNDENKDVQINFYVGGCYSRWRSLVSSSLYLPDIPGRIQVSTAQIHHFTRVSGEPIVDVFVLFIARCDVNFQRNGLWRVRPSISQFLQEPYRKILTYGRTGELRLV